MSFAENSIYISGFACTIALLVLAHIVCFAGWANDDFYQRLRTWRVFAPTLFLLGALPYSLVAFGFGLLFIYCLLEFSRLLDINRWCQAVLLSTLLTIQVTSGSPYFHWVWLGGTTIVAASLIGTMRIWPLLCALIITSVLPLWILIVLYDDFRNVLCSFLFLIALCDISCYIGGKLIGRTPLAVRISPNKTWEGVIFGTAVTTIIGLVIFNYWKPDYPVFAIICIGITVALLAQAGDLLFSAAKRQLNVKDFDTKLPGVGGILDHVDSMTLIAPLILMLP